VSRIGVFDDGIVAVPAGIDVRIISLPAIHRVVSSTATNRVGSIEADNRVIARRRRPREHGGCRLANCNRQ
jgi:hypothetical protein